MEGQEKIKLKSVQSQKFKVQSQCPDAGVYFEFWTLNWPSNPAPILSTLDPVHGHFTYFVAVGELFDGYSAVLIIEEFFDSSYLCSGEF